MSRTRKQSDNKATLKWIVALYIRLSKEDGNNESFSVTNQRKMLDAYTKKLKENENIRVYDYYIDDGLTGTDDTRKNFQRMIADIEEKKVNCVIVKDLSRSFRNIADQSYYLDEYFVRNNIRFISTDIPFIDSFLRPETMESIAVPIQGIMNESHPKETSRKVRATFHIKRTNGEFIGAFAPYGFIKDPNDKNKLLIDEEVADVVRDIFNYLKSGMSRRSIARELNRLGVPSPSAYKKLKGFNYQNPSLSSTSHLWTASAITRIGKDENYIGNSVQGKYRVMSYKVHKQIKTPQNEWFIVENNHPAIVSRDLFHEVQEILKRDVKTANHKSEPYLFSGFLKCADCKAPIHRQQSRKYVYYCCRTYKEHGKEVCGRHSIGEKELTEAVLVSLNAQLKLIEDIEKMIIEIANAPQTKDRLQALKNALTARDKELGRINQIRDGLYDDWKLSAISESDYYRRIAKYDAELSQVESSIRALTDELGVIETNLNTDDPFFQYYKQYKEVKTLDRNLLCQLVKTIYIKENKEIEIELRFADQLKHIVSLANSSQKSKVKSLSIKEG